MKKVLYILPLFLLIFVPGKANATEYYKRYVLVDTGLIEEQETEYVNTILSNESFVNDSKQYPYYMIIYQNGAGSPFQMGYRNVVNVMFFNEIPSFENNLSEGGSNLKYESTNAAKSYFYYVSDFSINNVSLGTLNFLNLKDQVQDSNGDYITYYDYNINYVLASNFSYSLGTDIDIYDINDNFLYTIKSDENIFQKKQVVVDKEYGISDIENAEDLVYSLSKQLLGDLPEEFSFLYSVVALGLGLLICFIVLSPFIIIFRIWR